MTEALALRLKEIHAKWEARNELSRTLDQNDSRLSLDGLRRAGQQSQERQMQNRGQIRKLRESSLYKIKESEPQIAHLGHVSSSVLYNCCNRCTLSSKDSLINTINKQYHMGGIDLMAITSGTCIFSKIFRHICHVCSCKKYDYPMVTDAVLNDPRLREAIETRAQQSLNLKMVNGLHAVNKAEITAKQIMQKLESNIGDKLLRVIVWTLYKVLSWFVQTVVQPAQIEVLKKANDIGLPLIFIAMHRSYLDRILISLTTFNNNIRSPLFAVGNNFNSPLHRWFLKGFGGFFLSRQVLRTLNEDDEMYQVIVHMYIMQCLKAGHNIEFSIEGGRTKTGKPCMPKTGILDVVVDAYVDGTIEDALIIPVTVNYERLPDGSFIEEQLGQSKKKTFISNIKALLSAFTRINGIAKINFCQPFSLREMLNNIGKSLNDKAIASSHSKKHLTYTGSNSSLCETRAILQEHCHLTNTVARHIIYDYSKAVPIMSTNIVAFLMLNKGRNGFTLDKLVEEFDQIKEKLSWSNMDLVFNGRTIDIINHAIDILGPDLIKENQKKIMAEDSNSVKSNFVTLIQPELSLPNVIELSYYSNTVMLHYIMESVIVTALHSIVRFQLNNPKIIAENNVTFFHDNLVEKALKICDILKYEFIFCKPCLHLEQAITEGIDKLMTEDVIGLKQEGCLEEEMWSKRYAHTFDDSSDDEYNARHRTRKIEYKLNLETERLNYTKFLKTILRPLIDTYSISAFSLKKLVGQCLCEQDLLHEVLHAIKSNLELGVINYGESLNVDAVKNSFKLFESWNIIEFYSQENIRMFYLADTYDDNESTNSIYESIAALI
ncbi:glycerol-3-phosphate acyltransferase 1, mitochondrial isoform X2 [Orussus abietinus]|nr:glycerol-3-phosphate acyltransferase 1, mitochondrial isoform X2 [Orussus abietinus]